MVQKDENTSKNKIEDEGEVGGGLPCVSFPSASASASCSAPVTPADTFRSPFAPVYSAGYLPLGASRLRMLTNQPAPGGGVLHAC